MATDPLTVPRVLAVLLLGSAVLAGCGSTDSDEEPRVQRVAFCQGPSADNPAGDPVEVEFRQGPTVVHRAWVSIGTAVTAEVPWGAVQIYVNGVSTAEVNEGVDPDAYRSPGPDDVTYVRSAEGCPESAPLPPPSDN